MCLPHTTTCSFSLLITTFIYRIVNSAWSFSLLSTTFIYRMVNVLASHYRLQCFITDHNFYLQNSEYACVTLPAVVFLFWSRLLFTEWWMSFRHTTTCSFSLLSPAFIYIIVNLLELQYQLHFFIIKHDIYLQSGECACVILPPADFHYWSRPLFTEW